MGAKQRQEDAIFSTTVMWRAWLRPWTPAGYSGQNTALRRVYRVTCTVNMPREKKGRLEVRCVPDIESLVDAVDRVHHFVILLFHR